MINILEKKAYERFANIRFANPDLAKRIEDAFTKMIRKDPDKLISDEQFKGFLMMFNEKKEFKWHGINTFQGR